MRKMLLLAITAQAMLTACFCVCGIGIRDSKRDSKLFE